MASINRGDNTGAFGQDFLRIYLNNPNELYIKKAIFQINGNLEKEFQEPVFPLRINFTGAETELLSQVNTCKLALWDEYGRRRTADGKFTFFCKENRINSPDDPTYNNPNYYPPNTNSVYFDLEEAEFAAEFIVNATPQKMSELQQDIYLMTPDKIIAGTNIRTKVDGLGNVIISAELDAKQSYNALTDKPSVNGKTLIGNVEIHLEEEIPQSDWTETDPESKAFILHKPVLATVAISGDYNDLVGRPIVPTKVSEIENDLNFVTVNVNNLTNYYTKAEVDVLISHEIDFRPIYEKIAQVKLELETEITALDENKVSVDDFEAKVLELQQGDTNIIQYVNTQIGRVDNEITGLKQADIALGQTITDAVNTLNASIDLKADKTQVDSLATQINACVPETTFNSVIATKVDKTDLGKGKLVLKVNDVEIGTFNANQKTNASMNFVVPVKLSDLDQDIQYVKQVDLSNYITLDILNQRLAEKVDLAQLGQGILTLTQNGTSIGTFNANQATNKQIDIVTPLKLSDLDQDIDYLVESDLDTINANITALQNTSALTTARLNDAEIEIAKKINYDSTKSLVDNTEINRLKNVHNYDDTVLSTKVDILEEKVDNFDTDISNKVDKIPGKGLSTNDYTDLEKDKVTSAYTKSNANTDSIVILNNNVTTLNTDVADLKTRTTNLNTLINDESTVRLTTDTYLQSQIDALQAKSTVVDIVADMEELSHYDTSKLQLNDVICVLQDENHLGAVSYYRWNTADFTYIGSEGTYYKKAESDERFVNRQTKVNGKTLTNDINLTYTDVGALPSTTVIGNGTLAFKVNGTELPTSQRFTANQTDNVVVELTIPTKLSELDNSDPDYFVTKGVLVQTFLGRPDPARGDGDNTLLWDKAYFLQDKIELNSTRIDVLEGNLPTVALTGNYYDLLNLPTSISSNYKTIAKDPTYTDYIDNTFVVELKTKSGFITAADVSSQYALKTEIPTRVSQLENDRGYLTNSSIGKGIISIFLQNDKLDSFSVNTREDLNIVIPVDDALSTTSVNPVQNKVIAASITSKAEDSEVVKLTGNQTIAGNKSFSDNVTLYNGHATTQVTSDNSTKIATTEFVKNQGYATDSGLVHIANSETITGTKTFDDVVITNGTATTQLVTDDSTKIATTAFVKSLGYAEAANVVHNSGNETIAGNKTFTGTTNLGSNGLANTPDGTINNAVVNVDYVAALVTQLNATIAALEARVATLESKVP